MKILASNFIQNTRVPVPQDNQTNLVVMTKLTDKSLGTKLTVTWQPRSVPTHMKGFRIYWLVLRYYRRLTAKISGMAAPTVFLCKDSNGDGAVPAAFEKVSEIIRLLW